MSAGPVIRCISPIDGELVVERPVLAAPALETVLDQARSAQSAWARAPLSERAAACHAFVEAMLALEDGIVPELARQMGRPVRFGAGELAGFAERARYMIEVAPEALAPLQPAPRPGFRRRVERTPLGLVLVIAPWNFPYLTAVNSVVPALMAGNAVLLKHAAQTLLVGDRFANAAAAAGLPTGLLSHITLDHATTNALLARGAVDQVAFTGSVGAGRSIEQALAGTFKGVGLELGGKDPAYVAPDADVAAAAEGLADGAFFNSGQSCCGIERIYVHSSVAADFTERLAEHARDLVLGSPLDPATTLGPMAQASGAATVRAQVAAALAAGARAHVDPRD